jgi:septal ring factor EnvC (AmiA/AmiB activator)
MRTSGKAALLIAVGALVIALVYSQSQWTIYDVYSLALVVGLILCGAGLAVAAHAVGFAGAEKKYASRLIQLAEDVGRKRRELKDLSSTLERERKKLSEARREVAAVRDELAAKRRQLAVVSGKLGEKEKRLKKIRKIVGAS